MDWKIDSTYSDTVKAADVIYTAQQLINHLCSWGNSPHALAHQVLYTECGSDKETATYERRKKVQGHFKPP